MATEQSLVHLDPAVILADDNSRFKLKPSAVETMMQSILDRGGVQTPIEVQPLKPGSNGHSYRLTSGFIRHEAVTRLNKEQAAALTIPAIVRTPADDKDRLYRQLAENIARENQSPMDQAISIKKLMDIGVGRGEIRRMFARPGGKKGNEVQPASNAWVNIMLRMLELPKAIQEKIHDGRVGVEAAYELSKVPAEKRGDVLQRAENVRLLALDREAKDEEKFLNLEAKLAETKDKEATALKAAEEATQEISKAEALAKEKAAMLKAAQKEAKAVLASDDKEAKKVATEVIKAAEADVKAAVKIATGAKNVLAKARAAAENAATRAKELEIARNAAGIQVKKAEKPVSGKDIKEAVAAETGGAVALTLSEVKEMLKDIIKSKTTPPKVKAVVGLFTAAVAGELTPKELVHDIAVTIEEPV